MPADKSGTVSIRGIWYFIWKIKWSIVFGNFDENAQFYENTAKFYPLKIRIFQFKWSGKVVTFGFGNRVATLNIIWNKNPVFPNKGGHTFWIMRSYFQASKVLLSHTFQQLKFIRNPVSRLASCNWIYYYTPKAWATWLNPSPPSPHQLHRCIVEFKI